jgi:hypothetical protein
MIYQCYFKKDQEPSLFKTDLYKPIGLEPEVNPDIAKNCLELEDPKLRLNLVEYGAFLHIYKNNVYTYDTDWWIGFTSHRQLDKVPIMFSNKAKFEELLIKVAKGFCGWGYYRTNSNLSNQSEICHPGINSFIKDVFAYFSIDIPERFYTDKFILFANYWAMTKELFDDFMVFSWPIIKYAMTLTDHPYTKTSSPIPTVSTDKWLGYFMERVFILWYMRRNIIPANFGPICGELV